MPAFRRRMLVPFRRVAGVLVVVLAAAGTTGQSIAAADQQEGIELQQLTSNGLFKQRPVWSPDGKSVVYAQHDSDTIFLFRMELASNTCERITDRKDPEYDAVFSPNGRSMLFSFDKTSPNQGDLEVYQLQLDTGQLTPAAISSGGLSHEESPSWSPDNRHFVFSSTKDGNQEIYKASLETEGVPWQRLTSDPAIDAHPTWSPDGRRIAFATNRWGDLEIAVMNADGSNLTRLTNSSGLDDYPAWSPDGEYLAYTGNRHGNMDIYVYRMSSGQVHRLTTSPAIDNFPAWTPDGQIGFVSDRGDGFDIYVTRQWQRSGR